MTFTTLHDGLSNTLEQAAFRCVGSLCLQLPIFTFGFVRFLKIYYLSRHYNTLISCTFAFAKEPVLAISQWALTSKKQSRGHFIPALLTPIVIVIEIPGDTGIQLRRQRGEWSVLRAPNVRVPLWPISGFVLCRPEFKSSATLVNSQLVASFQLGFFILLCCI